MTSTIPLPSLRVIYKQEKIEAEIKASLCVDLPSELRRTTTVDQLLKAVTTRQLWIARTGACYIQASIYVNNQPILENDCLEPLYQRLQYCELWDRLGIKLNCADDADTQLPGLMSFSIQHPDLTSALTAPTKALTAQFRSLRCSIYLTTMDEKNTADESRPKRIKKRKRKRQDKEADDTHKNLGDDVFLGLGPADRLAVENFMSELNLTTHAELDGDKRRDDNQYYKSIIEKSAGQFRGFSLLEVLLEQLMYQNSKVYKGYQLLGPPTTNPLLQLTPAVFSFHYLQAVSERASLLPSIASSLARMKVAESPSLRKKIANLKAKRTPANGKRKRRSVTNDWEKIMEGIETRGWEILIQNLKMPPCKAKPTLMKAKNDSPGPDQAKNDVDKLVLSSSNSWDESDHAQDETGLDLAPFMEIQHSLEAASCYTEHSCDPSIEPSSQTIDSGTPRSFDKECSNISALEWPGPYRPFGNLQRDFHTDYESGSNLMKTDMGHGVAMPIYGQMEFDPGLYQSFEDFLGHDEMFI